METVTLEIPAELLQAAKLSPEEAKIELAIRLYQQHKLNEEQAKQLAGVSLPIEQLAWGHRETGRINMDDFLSWASHDLKSPLNTIIGFTRVVIKGMDGPITPEQAADLNTAFTSSQRMLMLINHIVDMARLNIGHIQPHLAEANLANAIQEAVEKWQPANPSKPVTVLMQISNPVFVADALYIKQVVTSLLNYAAMRITEGALSLSAQDDENGLSVTIQSAGKKSRDKYEMDSAMFDFVCSGLLKLHGGSMAEPQETEDGLLIEFSLPRKSAQIL